MLILFDHGTPRGLARALAGHTVVTAKARGWERLNNGALLKAAGQQRLIFCSPLSKYRLTKLGQPMTLEYPAPR